MDNVCYVYWCLWVLAVNDGIWLKLENLKLLFSSFDIVCILELIDGGNDSLMLLEDSWICNEHLIDLGELAVQSTKSTKNRNSREVAADGNS